MLLLSGNMMCHNCFKSTIVKIQIYTLLFFVFAAASCAETPDVAHAERNSSDRSIGSYVR